MTMWGRKHKLRREAAIIWAKYMVYSSLSWALSLRYGRNREYRGWACILRNDGLGDFFISWPVLAGLADYFHARNVPVVVFSSGWMRDFIVATGKFDAVVPVEVKVFGCSLWRRLLTFAWLRHLAPEAFISLICGAETRLGLNDLIARFIGARDKYGCAMRLCARSEFVNRYLYLRHGNRFYNHLLSVTGRPSLPEIEAGLFRLVTGGAVPPPPEFPCPPAALPPELAAVGAYCVLVPGASAPGRRWPVENFREWAARTLTDNPGLTLVIVGTGAEKTLGAEIRRGLPDGAAIDLCGRTAVAELVAVIRGARFVLTNDTGAAHVSGRLRVPAVCVLGGGQFGWFAPCAQYPTVRYVYRWRRCFWCGFDCRQDGFVPGRAYPCVADIAVAEVLAQTASLARAV